MFDNARLLDLRDCGPATLHEICLPEKLEACEQQCKALLDARRHGSGEEEEW